MTHKETQITQAGGSAAINGMLYQILGCVGESMEISLNSKSTDDEKLESVNLVIEPKNGGGDLQIHFKNRSIFQQWKAKSDAGTWSFKQLIEKVLPDLYKSVTDSSQLDSAKYVFITEGRIGEWQEVYDSWKKLDKVVPDDVLSAEVIHSTDKLKCSKKKYLTTSEIIQEIANIIKKSPSIKDNDEGIIFQKIWKLLANFEFQQLKFRELKDNINRTIRERIDYAEDADGKRHELCGIVSDYSARGSVHISPNKILEDAGLTAKSFRTDWAEIKASLDSILKQDLISKAKYILKLDVKSSPDWLDDSNILILYGESGNGKTWQLASLALSQQQDDRFVVFLRSKGDVDETLQAAANVVWHQGKGHQRELKLHQIADHYKTTSTRTGIWLTLCIDDINTYKELDELLAIDWENQGIRLAVTSPVSLKKDVEQDKKDTTYFFKVTGFTRNELSHYLELNKYSWAKFPADVREILKIPLFATLFVNLKQSNWKPKNEYELFSAYWQRINNADHRFAESNFIKLVGHSIKEGFKHYPWSLGTLLKNGLDENTLIWLENKGWLHASSNRCIEVWHDRLLNWVVAQALVELRLDQEISREELCGYLSKFYLRDHPIGKEQINYVEKLGYVPMDVLWLVSTEPSLQDETHYYIEALENTNSWTELSILYEELLPTLGSGIVPSIIQRFKYLGDDKLQMIIIEGSKCLIQIGKTNKEIVAHITPLLKNKSNTLVEIALLVLEEIPDQNALDDLWFLLKDPPVGLTGSDRYSRIRREALIISAMTTVLEDNPKWIESTILNTSENEPLFRLSNLLATVEGKKGHKIWQTVKEKLFKSVPENYTDSLIRCIDTFNDKSESQRLKNWLGNITHDVHSSVFNVLARFEPLNSIQILTAEEKFDLYLDRKRWLPSLVLYAHTQFFSHIYKLCKVSDTNCMNIAIWFQGNEDEIQPEMFELMLKTLEQLINNDFPVNDRNFDRFLNIVADVNKVELLDLLSKKAGSELESTLTKQAISRTGQNHMGRDYTLHTIRMILLNIGGLGFTQLINQELAHEEYYTRFNALNWAFTAPNEETKQLLRVISLKKDKENLYEQCRAVLILAALNDNSGVINSILQFGTSAVERKVSIARQKQAPFTDEELKSVFAIIHTADIKNIPSALVILSISGRHDLSGTVLEILEKYPNNAEISLFATVALYEIGRKELKAITALASQLRVEKNCPYAICALFRIGTQDARLEIQNYIASLDQADKQSFHIIDAICNLAEYTLENKKTAWEIIKTPSSTFHSTELFALAVKAQKEEVLDFLWDTAFAPKSNFRIIGKTSTAIQGMKEQSKEDAFEAASAKIWQKGDDRSDMPKILVEIDAKKAIPLLCEQAVKEWENLCLWEIGRVLRNVETNIVENQILTMLESDNSDERIAGVFLCGWQSKSLFQDRLKELALNDAYREVRISSIEALKRQKAESNIIELLDMFASKRQSQQWAYLDAILNIGDPYLLSNKNDKLWLGHTLKDKSYIFHEYSNKKIEKRKKKLDEDLKKNDA